MSEDESKTCAACGAFMNRYDTLCPICGAIAEEVLGEDIGDVNLRGAMDEVECPSCGAFVKTDTGNCSVCGEEIGLSLGDVDAELDAVETTEEEHRECPECGALQENGSDECFLCGAAIPLLDVPDQAPDSPIEDAPQPEEPSIDTVEITEEEHRECLECGALQENGSDECFLCGAAIDTPAIEAPTEVTEAELLAIEEVEQPVIEEELEETVIEDPPPEDVAEPADDSTENEAEPVVDDTEDVSGPADETSEDVPAPSEEVHIECPGCGASLDADATECFLCDTVIIADDQSPETSIEEPETIIEEVTVTEEIIEEYQILPEEPVPTESLEENGFEIAAPEDLPDEVEGVVDDIIEEEVPQLAEDEVFCPSCSNVIKRDVEKCTECWTDLSLYATCDACGGYLRVDATTCPNCFATLITEEPAAAEVSDGEFEQPDVLMDIDLEEVEVSLELEVEMTALEEADENDKECLVCGAHFLSQDDEFCPICGVKYGVEIDEWVEPEKTWDGFEVLVPPTAFICPSCNEKVVGLEKSSREINEEKWFYRGIITIFIGIFFTTFSVWLRGISLESQSVGVRPPPFDVAVSLAGWILVLMGFAFWFISYRINQELIECPQCSVEVTEDLAHCINCSMQLVEDDELPAPPEKTQEEDMSFLPEDADMEAFSQQILEAEELADEIIEDEYIDEPVEEISEEDDLMVIEEDLGLEVEDDLEGPDELEEPVELGEPEELSEPELDILAEEVPLDEPLTIDEPVDGSDIEDAEEELEPISVEPLTEDDLAAPFEVDDPMEEPPVDEPDEPQIDEAEEELVGSEPIEESAEIIDEPELEAPEDTIEPEVTEVEPDIEITEEAPELEPEVPVAAAVSEAVTEPEAEGSVPEEEHRECSECGALQENGSDECFLCGAHIEATLEGAEEASIEPEIVEQMEEPAGEVDDEPIAEELGSEPEADMPVETVETPMAEPEIEVAPLPDPTPEPVAEEEHIDCAGCGASLEADSTECFLCGEAVSIVSEPDIPDMPEESDDLGAELPTEHEEHKKCPGCGIFVDEGVTECPVCDTAFDDDDAISSVEGEVDIPRIESEPEMGEPTKEVHIDCPECGASLDADSEECFLCGAELGTTMGLPDMDTSDAEAGKKKECGSCGAIVEESETMCSICDEPLDE